MKRIALTLTLAVALSHCAMVRDNALEIVMDTKTGMMWQDNGKESAKTWIEAKQYCENLTLGGLSGWRLPSKSELEGIIDENNTPKIKNRFKHVGTDVGYWSGTTYSINIPAEFRKNGEPPVEEFAHGVWFINGMKDMRYTTVEMYARCIRSGQL